jgi:hypothetical protein
VERRYSLTRKGKNAWDSFFGPLERAVLMSPAQSEIVYTLNFHRGCEEHWTADELRTWINRAHKKRFTVAEISGALRGLVRRRYIK